MDYKTLLLRFVPACTMYSYYGIMKIILTIHNQSSFFTVHAKPVCNYSIAKKMDLHVQIENQSLLL